MPYSHVDGDHPFHGFETSGGVAQIIPPRSRGPLEGVFGAGMLTIEGSSHEVGSYVTFTWEGSYVPWAVPE